MEQESQNWIRLDLQQEQLQKQLKEIKKQKDEIGTRLMELMNANNVETISTNNEKVVLKKTVKLSAINQEYIKDTLNTYFSNHYPNDAFLLAKETSESLINNRESTESMFLKRIKKKQS